MRTRKQTREEEHAAEARQTVVSITKVEAPTISAAVIPPPKREVSRPRSAPSKLPKLIQFPLVTILSLSLAAVGYSLTWRYTKGPIAPHTRLLTTWDDVAIVTGWSVFKLALAWFGNFDGYDITALNILSHGPLLYLLNTFYQVPSNALLITLAIETLATYIPFRLLRPLSTVHADPSHAPNADIVTDRPIVLLTTLLAGAIYSVTLFLAYATYLPSYLVMYFTSLPTVASAHETTYVGLLPVTLVLGFAARAFIFTPAGATAKDKEEPFNPTTATLGETVRWNFWGWSAPTKVVIQRTALLMLVSGVDTFIQTLFTIKGVETPGAAAWSSVWVIAAAVTGLALGAVGSV
ncbi:uncharacterized protein F4812DRAFT_327157 [Daldinia caldariorum]|uniref:uncharacterized protein n=1 Tax=Daldinia caldariorum TaxID=326644 RepID=UPI002007EF5F|nr:uncharacterized protein F4812DRAFT_327157 [Daldinia caldariorum]KAI1469366.1 hypothetical protein F4812DRAFT_327157 [Daldinia caldariorum]